MRAKAELPQIVGVKLWFDIQSIVYFVYGIAIYVVCIIKFKSAQVPTYCCNAESGVRIIARPGLDS
jgi:hypothetical protein